MMSNSPIRTSKSVVKGLQRRHEVFSIYSNTKSRFSRDRMYPGHSSFSNGRNVPLRPRSDNRSL